MSYEFKRQDAYDLAATFQTEKKEKGNELFFRECPYCHGGKHKDKDSFSINLNNGTFHCFRSGCGKSGHFVQLARDFDFRLDFGEKFRAYRKLPQKKIKVRPAAITYLQSRGISEDVCLKYRITTQTNHQNILVFPFFDEEGIMQYVKYRKTDFDKSRDKNKEWSESEAKPILFGMDQCVDFGSVVITEGQIDCLSVAEAGFQNVVSVPNGAKGFTWYDHCSAWLDKFEEVIVFGDCEDGKITLVEELQARLRQRLKVVQVADYLGEKDANDILRKYGKAEVKKAVENAAVPAVKKLKDLSEISPVDINNLLKVKTKITPLDKAVGGLYMGQVSLLSGKRGEGKSTLMSQFVAEALDQDATVMVYSGELPDFLFKRWLDLQLAGKANLDEKQNEYGEPIYSIPENVQSDINEWYKGRAFIYDNNLITDEEHEEETLLVTIEKAIRNCGAKLIFIDNLMTAMECVDNQKDLYAAQSSFVWKLKRLAMRFNVHIMLVAHPRKTKQGEALNNDDISGSGDITNKVDLVFFYDKTADGDGKLTVTKNRLTGRLLTGQNAVVLAYSASCKRITSAVDSSKKSYGWENKTAPEGFEALQDDADFPF